MEPSLRSEAKVVYPGPPPRAESEPRSRDRGGCGGQCGRAPHRAGWGETAVLPRKPNPVTPGPSNSTPRHPRRGTGNGSKRKRVPSHVRPHRLQQPKAPTTTVSSADESVTPAWPVHPHTEPDPAARGSGTGTGRATTQRDLQNAGKAADAKGQALGDTTRRKGPEKSNCQS